MKRLFVLSLIAVAILTMGFTPSEYMGYSATKTGDSLIHTGAGWFYGFVVFTDGTNAVTLKIYDGVDATGSRIGPDFYCSSSSTNRTCVFGTGDLPLGFNTGLYVDVTSSDATPDFTVFYRGK